MPLKKKLHLLEEISVLLGVRFALLEETVFPWLDLLEERFVTWEVELFRFEVGLVVH